MYRAKLIGPTMARLRRVALERVNCLTIQRAFRGYLGRRRLNLKREFVKNIAEAKARVSLRELSPGDVEDLADLIDMALKDYTVLVSYNALTVLRAILYMFNGDLPESIVVSSSSGLTEKKYITAKDCTWYGVKLILRRKGKFLRRLRALINRVSLPNSAMLTFTSDCKLHLKSVITGLDINSFDDMTLGKVCIVQLFKYCRHVQRVLELQDHFPEYFYPGQPDWFRKVMRLKEDFDKSDISSRIESHCKIRLEERKHNITKEGRSWRHVSEAIHINEIKAEEAKMDRKKKRLKLTKFIEALKANEGKKVFALKGIERAQELALDVAIGVVREYRKLALVIDEKKLKELLFTLDTKALALLQTRADLETQLETNSRNELSRDFDNIISYKTIHKFCKDLGYVMADLMVLLNDWKKMLKSIGGIQYVKDLKGKRKEYYDNLRNSSLFLMADRRRIRNEIETELRNQYSIVLDLAYEAGVRARDKHWDLTTVVEKVSEDEENLECCRRETDFEARQKRQLEFASIQPAVFVPCILLIDSRIPICSFHEVVDKLNKFGFLFCETSINDPNIVEDLQKHFDDKKSIILIENRGSHEVARGIFRSKFNTLVKALVPPPRIILLDCSLAARAVDWFSDTSSKQSFEKKNDTNNSFLCDVLIKKMRKTSLIFRYFIDKLDNSDVMMEVIQLDNKIPENVGWKYPILQENGKCKLDNFDKIIPTWMCTVFKSDYKSFLTNVRNERSKFKHMTIDIKADFLLAATISCILGIWEAPLREWDDSDIIKGSKFLSEKINFSSIAICELLYIDNYISCDFLMAKRLENLNRYEDLLVYLNSIDFYRNTARCLLNKWMKDAVNLVQRYYLN